mgnify:CR=1 FL=1
MAEQGTPLRRAWVGRDVAVTIGTRGEWFTGEARTAVVPLPHLTHHFPAVADIEGFSGVDTLDRVIRQDQPCDVLEDVLEQAARREPG